MGINPYGVMPFAYIVDSSISTEPVPKDDVLAMSINIPVLLTDLSFASKYQSYSLLWTKNFDGDLPAGPAGVVHLGTSNNPDVAPEIGALSQNVDINGILKMIENNLNYLLTTNGLKVETISGEMTASNASSGVSKALDRAEIAINQKDKKAYLLNFESQIWDKIPSMVEYWIQQGLISDKYDISLSDDFNVAVYLQDPKVAMTELEQIELSKAKIAAGFSTLKREIKKMNPDMSMVEVEAFVEEIRQEKVDNFNRIRQEMNNGGEGQIQDQPE
jgi:hypothetical protein